MSYAPDRSEPVTVQVRGLLEQLLGLTRACGSLLMNTAPTDADVLTISDGVTAIDYTFVAALTGAANEVLQTGNATATATLLFAAINVNAPAASTGERVRGIDALNPSAGVVTLDNTKFGSEGNVAIAGTAADHFTIVGMVGGEEDTVAVDVAVNQTRAELIPAVTGKQIHVYAHRLSAGGASGTYLLESGAGTKVLSGTISVGVNGGEVMDSVTPIFKGATGANVNITTSASTTVDGWMKYRYVTL